MATIEEIKAAISRLPKDQYREIRKWFSEEDWNAWDAQLEKDSASGALDFLVEEAAREESEQKLRDL